MKPRSNAVPITTYLAWTTALVALLGSLYFSEIKDLTPCLLCWYQRIAMYPLVVILTVGIIRRDSALPFYALPLSIAGTLIAVYHNLLQQGVIDETSAPCREGVSCTTKQIEYFGIDIIPALSLLAFVIISVCMALYFRKRRFR